MRFLIDGPSIPDELLIARDEGRTMFFCGSGVSIAKANLTDFFGLAESVLDYLGVQQDNPARKIITNTTKFEKDVGFSGLVSADRVFGILEREFLRRDIEEAVAKSLKPDNAPDLSAHKAMLDLATLPDGKLRLVTTNFDLLFEACNHDLPISSPSRLPDPHNYKTFEGIIHLHGCVNDDYSGASSDGFVLSPSEFGRAYLSDGWATEFIKSVLSKYIVVFVGYTADDPPVQYLLEALHNFPKFTDQAYAFQSGAADEAEAKWRHKGVHPIAYNAENKHKALWDTMTEWASRAKDPTVWIENTLCLAQQGPEGLKPHQRGQVTHIVSTLEGARQFSSIIPILPAEWLCVFDPAIRFGTPSNVLNLQENDYYFDPFIAYGIDSDPIPDKIGPEDYMTTRKIPKEAWSCFDSNKMDHKNQRSDSFSRLTGFWSTNISNLPARIEQLCVWIAKVSNQPAAVWWASMQNGLHPSLQRQIQRQIYSEQIDIKPEIRQAWKLIFTARPKDNRDVNDEWFRLKRELKFTEWTEYSVKEYVKILCPYLVVDKTTHGGPRPPSIKEEFRLSELARFELKLPLLSDIPQIPAEFLELLVQEIRKNLELASILDTMINGFNFDRLSPIEQEFDSEDISNSTPVLNRADHYISYYIKNYKNLVESNPEAAKREYLSWNTAEDNLFTRLRIWALRYENIVNAREAGATIVNMNNSTFWDRYHQPDLLLVLSKHWKDFTLKVRKKIERKLLKGRDRFKNETQECHQDHRIRPKTEDKSRSEQAEDRRVRAGFLKPQKGADFNLPLTGSRFQATCSGSRVRNQVAFFDSFLLVV